MTGAFFMKKELKNTEKIELHPDIYTLTFLKFYQTDNPIIHKELVKRAMLCLMAQLGLVYYIYKDSQGISGIVQGSFELNCVRLICALILHITLIPEIRSSFTLMEFVKINHEQF